MFWHWFRLCVQKMRHTIHITETAVRYAAVFFINDNFCDRTLEKLAFSRPKDVEHKHAKYSSTYSF